MANGYRREPNWYLADGTYNRLSRAAIVTLAHLTRCMDGKGWTGCLSTSRLIELTGLGKSSVARAIVELKEAGILDRENGEHRYSIRPDPRPTGGTDCPTDGTTCAPPVGHERPTGGTSAPHGWDSHPYSSKTLIKNTHQEGVCFPSVPYPHRENGTIPVREAAERLFDSVGWPKARRGGEGGVRLLSDVLLRLADGWGDESARSDPVSWIQVRMMARVRDAESERFVPAFAKWVRDEYPHLAQQEQPA